MLQELSGSLPGKATEMIQQGALEHALKEIDAHLRKIEVRSEFDSLKYSWNWHAVEIWKM